MAQPRALVVDDDAPIRALLATLVAQHGYAVETAGDGAEAIDRLSADGYSLVLLDLMMPRVDGYAVLHHIKESKPELLRCTIIASAVPEREILAKVADPVYKIHVKPFDMPRLISDIRTCGT
jgi:two-component system KDP operon response regulator KdpE